MPNFAIEPSNLEDAVMQILASIAMEEIGFSHILNAEGEKIQYMIGTLDANETAVNPGAQPTVSELLDINDSVANLLQTVSINQLHLFNKMNVALNAYISELREDYEASNPQP
ncbi:MAG: hypothetical protein FWG30_11670 [Eubacteriaceae bacterium]|nr:hypothetical protein [Eubacteriaceae bacterium]